MKSSTLVCLFGALAAAANACAHGRTVANAARESTPSRVVNIAQGPVRGYKDPDYDIYAFHSIPYATAPTGRDKFKAPLPPPTWSEPLDAVDRGIICPQPSSRNARQETSQTIEEDCLIASVYVPDTNETNLPVMAYVHGGAFQVGYANSRVHRTLIAEDKIIMVNFNYRVGPHGFLCLGTDDVPGNAGMKDQVALLRWVRDNIQYFGGDPNDVTIAGCSAGSASVDLIMLSKMADGLYNKVIALSGANIAAFTIQPDPIENARDYAKILNFDNVDDIDALEEFYRNISYDELYSISARDRPDSSFYFSPCVEGVTAGEQFLTESPVDIIRQGHYKQVPLLYGFTDMEGQLKLSFYDAWRFMMDENFSDFLPTDLKFENITQKNEVARSVKEFYFGDTLASDNILGYINYFTDNIFTYPMLRAVNLHVGSGHDQIYLHEYSFVDTNTDVVPNTNVRGATHCAQTMALALAVAEGTQATREFIEMSDTLRQIWSSFIKTGKPVRRGSSLPEWPAVGANWSPHMSLGTEVRLEGSLLETRGLFWDAIYSKYYRDPVPPNRHGKKNLQ